MTRFISAYPDFQSRFNRYIHYIHFGNYSIAEP